MSNSELAAAPCSECGGNLARRAVSQEFERDGVRVEIAGVRAPACGKCGVIYFEPGGAQALTEAVNGLFQAAPKSKSRLNVRVLAPVSETKNQPLKTEYSQENYVFNCP